MSVLESLRDLIARNEVVNSECVTSARSRGTVATEDSLVYSSDLSTFAVTIAVGVSTTVAAGEAAPSSGVVSGDRNSEAGATEGNSGAGLAAVAGVSSSTAT